MSGTTNDTAATRLGIRIDALDQALSAFELKRLESLIALRRQIEFTRHEALASGFQEIAQAAERAYSAGALEATQSARDLLSIMRETALKLRARAQTDHDIIDPATGLMKREAFARIFAELTHKHPHVAVAAIQITNAAEVRQRFGPELAHRLNAHVGAALARSVRAQDCVASFEDDHFTIFLPGEDSRGLASALKRFEHVLSQHPFSMPDGTSTLPVVSITGRMLDRKTSAEPHITPDDLPVIGIVSRSTSTARVLEMRLRTEGFHPLQAATAADSKGALFGEQALDLALLDVRAEELEDLAVDIRRCMSSRRAPILALVGDEDEGRRAQAAGISGYLRRPLDLDAAIGEVRRQLKRNTSSDGEDMTTRAGRLLIASNDLYPLIAIGTAMHRHIGCEVYLARGTADAIAQIRRQAPATVLLDLRLQLPGTTDVLKAIAEAPNKTETIIIIEEYERTRASMIHEPRITDVIVKPFHLLSLAEEVRKATGLAGRHDPDSNSALLKSEIARVMQPAAQA